MGVKGYKAFSKGLICKNKQYTENTVFEENGTKICGPGVMHFCENPFDVLNYYPLVDNNGDICEFANVEAIGNLYKNDDKCATNKLKVGAKLNLKGFIKACIDFTSEKKTLKTNDFSGDNAQLVSSGDNAQLASSGDYAKLVNSGDNAKLASSGDFAKLVNSGYNAKLANSGDYAQLVNSGDNAQLVNSGDFAKLVNSGYNAKLASSGEYAQLVTTGERSVVAAVGVNSIAKARVGSWITLAEWGYTENEEGKMVWAPKCVKTEYVDGERIKEDVFYKLSDGKFEAIESIESEE